MISPAKPNYLVLTILFIYIKQYQWQFKEAAIPIPANSSSAARAQETPASNSIICGRSSSLSNMKSTAAPKSHFISVFSSKTRASTLIFNNPEKEAVTYLDKIKCANGYLSETLGSSLSRNPKSWQKKIETDVPLDKLSFTLVPGCGGNRTDPLRAEPQLTGISVNFHREGCGFFPRLF